MPKTTKESLRYNPGTQEASPEIISGKNSLDSAQSEVALMGLIKTLDRLETSAEKLEKEKMEKGIKVVIGGPPHSGKSVFTNGVEIGLDRYIKDNADSNISYYGMQANPDGEGVWYQLGYNNAEVAALRRKGDFTPEFADRAAEDVAEWNQTPILLVDIGGVISPENTEIIKGATHAIIVNRANDTIKEDPDTAQWEQFFEKNGLQVIAKVRSDYDEGDDEVREGKNGQIIGSVHHLERGEDTSARFMVEAVTKKIIDLARKNTFFWEAQERRCQSVVRVSDFLKEAPQLRLNNGEDGRGVLSYKPEITKYIYGHIGDLDPSGVEFTGAAPKWLYASLACAAAETGRGDISMYSRRFYKIEPLPVVENGHGAEWQKEQIGGMNGHPVIMLKETSIGQSGRQIKQEDLQSMSLPEMPPDSIICFSAQGPNWLSASVALGYMGKIHAFAEWQPVNKSNPDGKSGSIICWSRNRNDLGLTVEDFTAFRSEDYYLKESRRNLLDTSRTANGIIDTSSSRDKLESMQIGGGQEAAELAENNFSEAIHEIYEAKDRQFYTQGELRGFIERVAAIINRDIVKEGSLIRNWDSEEHNYVATADLPQAMEKFYSALFFEMNNPLSNPIETAAFVEYNIDLSGHYFSDGCSKVAKAASAFVLMRRGYPLPEYKGGRDAYYDNAPRHRLGESLEIDKMEYDKFLDFYQTLFMR